MRLRVALAGLLVVTAGLFTVGTAIERGRDGHHSEASEASEEPGAHDESAERHPEGEEARESEESGHEEEVLGVNLESPALVALGAFASLLLAGLVWRTHRKAVLVAVVAFATAFAVLDILEATRKLDEDAAGLALMAGALAAAHLVAAGLATTLYRSVDPSRGR